MLSGGLRVVVVVLTLRWEARPEPPQPESQDIWILCLPSLTTCTLDDDGYFKIAQTLETLWILSIGRFASRGGNMK